MNRFVFEFHHPAANEPEWKDKVARWSQLDYAAYGLVEAYMTWKPSLARPSLMILASPGASNETDRKFALGGAASPSVFVHTLPNIRCSPLCQVMEWSGPVLCVQKDPQTFVSGVREGFSILSTESPVVWVIAIENRSLGPHRAHLIELKFESRGEFEIHEETGGPESNDEDWFDWLEKGEGDFILPDGLRVDGNQNT